MAARAGLEAAARMRQTGVTLKQLYEFGRNPTPRKVLANAQRLHHEVPIRLAHRAMELATLPDGLSAMPSVQEVRQWYVQSFEEIMAVTRPESEADAEVLTGIVRNIKQRHQLVVPTLAMGLQELQSNLKSKDRQVSPEISRFLDRFYMSRIGIRMLLGQHIAMAEDQQRPGQVGIISELCSPSEIAEAATRQAKELCRLHYGVAPKVLILGRNVAQVTFPYMESHLFHMLFELLKNSMRAVVEHHGDHLDEAEYPVVRVVISEGAEDVSIKVSDEGGGIPRSGLGKVWTYLYTTAPPVMALDDHAIPPLAGLGFGLPISRLYARYFGGDLKLIPIESYGTDAYLFLNRLGTSVETLA